MIVHIHTDEYNNEEKQAGDQVKHFIFLGDSLVLFSVLCIDGLIHDYKIKKIHKIKFKIVFFQKHSPQAST